MAELPHRRVVADEAGPVCGSLYFHCSVRMASTASCRRVGAAAYPIERTCCSCGQLTELRTYPGDTGWDDAVWPAATAGTADLTRWTYGTTTGLLLGRTDANNAAVTYTYDLARRRSTRTWARGVVTTYAYDPASGDLTGTSYSDGTPAVNNTYDRRGRLATVVDGSGSRSFTYTASGQVADETITYTGEPARTLTSTYDAWSRRTGIRVVGAYGSDSNITYSETTGLPIRPLGNYDSPAPVSYLPNSALPEFAGDSVRLTWSASRDVLESIGTPAYPGYGWSFTSTRDALSRITAESRDLGDGNGPSVRGFVYNSRSEVTASTGESYAYDA
jgi:YD repeat-containing protein